MPKAGDVVYLFAKLRGDARLGFHKATVLDSFEEIFGIEYEKKGIELGGTSGAPILDSKGFVVALNVGGYEEDGKSIGLANPMPAILKLLKQSDLTKR